jgi:hypothetical protein
MSIATVELELSCRSGSALLPQTFGIDLLVALIREMAIVADDKMEAQDLANFGKSVRSYIQELIGFLAADRLAYYEKNTSTLIPLLCAELYDCLRDELISRLVQYSIRTESLAHALDKILQPSN